MEFIYFSLFVFFFLWSCFFRFYNKLKIMEYSQKMIILVLVLMMPFVINGDEIDPNYTYDDFMKKFNRTYSGDEKLHH